MLNKKCNNCGFQQKEFLNLGGRNYCNHCNSEIKSNNNKKQDVITISAYESQSTYDLLYGSLEWLELYVEKANYYPNWKNKKQLPKTITRSDIDSIDATRMRSMFSTSLTSLRSLARSKPDFFLEKLQGEFYKWLDGSGINVDNCPSELTQCLINLFEILKGKGEEFAKARREEVRKNIEKMSNEERQTKFNGIVSAYQEPLENEEKRAKSLEGQTYRDISFGNNFGGDADRGKEKFELIKRRLESSQREAGRRRDYDEMETEEFSNDPRQTLIENIKKNIDDYEFQEVIVFNGHYWDGTKWVEYGNEKKEKILIHKSVVRLEKKYNQFGALEFDHGKMFDKQKIGEQGWVEIEQAKLRSEKNSSHQIQDYSGRRGGNSGGKGGFGNPLIWGSSVVISLIGLAFVK